MRCTVAFAATVLCLLSAGEACRGQVLQPTAARAVTTRIRFEVLMPRRSTGLAAQRWGPVFQQAGESVRFRPPLLEDRPAVTEVTRGRTRTVTAIGELKSDGSLVFPGRRFRLSDARKLVEWIRELKTYGAQGAPQGQPGFGLSPGQLDHVLRILASPVRSRTGGLPIRQALEGMDLPDSLPLRLMADAEDQLRALPAGIVAPQDLQGLSHGTALAILLSRARLGFRPGRTPSGSLELVVTPLGKDAGLWPVGWPLDRPPVHVAPKYVDLVVFELEEKALPELLDEARQHTGLRILIDVRRIAETDLNLEAVRITQRRRRMTWSGLLDRGLFPDLMSELLQDEAGQPFLWITTRTTAQLNERAKQREARLKSRSRQGSGLQRRP